MTDIERSKLARVVISHYPRTSTPDFESLLVKCDPFPPGLIAEAIAAEHSARGQLFDELDEDAVLKRCLTSFPLLTGRVAQTIEQAHDVVWQLAKTRTQEQAEAAFEYAGVPRRFTNATLDDHVRLEKKLSAKVKRHGDRVMSAIEAGKLVSIFGPNSNGKTHFAAAIVKQWTRLGRSAQYVTGGSLIGQIHAAWKKLGAEERLARRLTRCGLLVVDDLYEIDGLTARSFARLLIERADDERPSILVSRLDWKTVAQSIGEAAAGRVDLVAPFDWPSFRNGPEVIK